MGKHTPGPWTQMISGDLVGADGVVAYEFRGATATAADKATVAANRALIAAAPELLKALEALRHQSDNCWCQMAIGNPMYTDHSDACKKARAAIAKARGTP